MRATRKLAAVLGAAALVSGVAVAASAAASSTTTPTASNTVFHGCVNTRSRLITDVFTEQVPNCPAGSFAVTWDEQGPKGATGAQGPAGPQGAQGPTGPQGLPGASGAQSGILYSSIKPTYSPSDPPPDWWSLGFVAAKTIQIGDKINLVGSGPLTSVDVILDSQACQNTGSCTTTPGATFPVPLTFTIYNANGGAAGTPGAVIASQTETFNVPYRPSASPTECSASTESIFPGSSNDGSQWYDPATGDCYYGITYDASFDFGHLPLPPTVVYGISFDNSADATTAQQSLNVLYGTEQANGAVTVGADTDPGNLFVQPTAASVEGGADNADLGGPGGQITCSTVSSQSFEEYNTAVGASGCGTDTLEGAGAPFEPLAEVPAVQFNTRG